jgi:hypothetical protein
LPDHGRRANAHRRSLSLRFQHAGQVSNPKIGVVFERDIDQEIGWILEATLPEDQHGGDDLLLQAALAVEQDEELAAEMVEWEAAAIGDGLDQLGS